MLSPELLNELRIILKEDYDIELNADELAEFARAFVAYGELLAKIDCAEAETMEAQQNG